jgi:hypothetical protein
MEILEVLLMNSDMILYPKPKMPSVRTDSANTERTRRQLISSGCREVSFRFASIQINAGSVEMDNINP